MKKNVGTIDKAIRIIVAIALSVLYYLGVISGTLGIVGLVVAIAMVFTSFVSFCPLYAILGINSCPAPNKNEK